MSGELVAAGAMATAGLVAGAIEGRETKEGAEGACLNCGAQLNGAYCSACGQSAHPHRSLIHVFEEFLHGVIHFDTKAWRTLPMVVFRPGTLTRNYVYGKRARYISPLALFLFTVFLMFFAFAFIEAPVGLSGTPEEQRAEAVRELDEAREELAEAERELAREIARPPEAEDYTPGLEVRLARQAVELARADVERRERFLAQYDRVIAEQSGETPASEAAPAQSTEAQPATPAASPDAPPSVPTEAAAAEAEEAAAPEQSRSANSANSTGIGWGPGETWQDGVRRWAESDDFLLIPNAPELNQRAQYKLQNPDLALYKIQQTGYKFSFLLVPLSLPFIALLFLWKRGVTFYDHVVYALYALSFASILFVTIVMAGSVTWLQWAIPWLLLAGLPIHTFFHLGGAYKLGWFSALWRTIFMLVFAMIIMSIFLTTIFFVGLVG